MSDSTTIMRQKQHAIRRELDRRGITLKQVQFDSGVPMSSLLSYFPLEGSREPAVMPVSALFAIIQGEAIPLDLLSLLMPGGHVIVRVPEEIDHDEVAPAMLRYLQGKADAHRPESPSGREISACEDMNLRAQLAVVGRKLAA